MAPRKLYDPRNGVMRVAGFMSGTGSNLRRIIEHEKKLEMDGGKSPYQVSIIFSDNNESNANKIGADFVLPFFIYDMNKYYQKRNKPLKDMEVREEFENECVPVFRAFDCSVAAYAGYMRKATEVFVNSLLGINVHPADLTIRGNDGKPKYTGDRAVRDAILSGERYLRATTHIIEKEVDLGGILMVSSPLEVSLPERFDINNKGQVNSVSNEHQDRLKEMGDWVIFPRTLEYIADGRFSRDEKGIVYFDEQPIPNGLRLD